MGLPALVASSTSSNENLEHTTSNQNILGGELPQNQWIEQSISVDKRLKE